ncbi:glycoside hydrolase N-terminal domain-containing protein [Streptomyces yanii]|uniref:Glycoside hydrolase N-terminal domain-containing protein n=1 Tax=Streptomyces yanii TaxID=78510 RepID=A0ABV5RNR9_9ACTN
MYIAALVAGVLLLAGLPALPRAPAAPLITAAATSVTGKAHTLWYGKPAASWERESLPIGNGSLGANFFGGVAQERLTFNEKTLWTGGPGSNEGGHPYDHGNWEEPRPGALDEVRQRIDDETQVPSSWVGQKLGQYEWGFGAYQPFGDLLLGFSGQDGNVSDYVRSLDLQEAVGSVSYRAGGTSYRREYLASNPHGVVAVRLTADAQNSISFDTSFTSPHAGRRVSAEDGRLTVRGKLPDNGLVYEGQIQVIAEGGTTTSSDSAVKVSGADAATLIFSAGTDYANDYPKYRGEDPHESVTRRVDTASALSFAGLRAAHVRDHKALFDRMTLDLGEALPAVPTDTLLAGYTGDRPEDRALEQLFFEYGRYLLIASSRPGSLPANLQGVWNNMTAPPWDSDYHVNINLQMNYWPAELTNLSETTAPLFEYADSLREPGRASARQIFGVDKGWVVSNQTNTWGFTGVHDYADSFWYPEGGAWLGQHFMEHYRFTGDRRFLRERAYPYLKETAEFWLDFLVEDPRDGKLVVTPSFSPEHGPFSAGASMSQQIVWDLLNNTVDASEELGIDAPFRTKVKQTLEKLDPGTRIGSWGQLQEWKEDWDNPADQHRHVSHLFGLYPGHQISRDETPELAKAAAVSLRARGDAGTGWSTAWKTNFWARLGDGDQAHRVLALQLSRSTLPNLWDSYPPFQIDGNFGATAGMAEMLLQSDQGVVDLLPALPSGWDKGRVDGLRARGGYTVGMDWQAGTLNEARIKADREGTVRVRDGGFRAGLVRVVDEHGRAVPAKVRGNVIEVRVDAGETIRILPQGGRLGISDSRVQVKPGEPVTADVTVSPVGNTTLPVSRLSVTPADGWTATPGTTKFPPLKAGDSRTLKLAFTPPQDVEEGTHVMTVRAESGRWKAEKQLTIVVRRHNLALGQPATQSTTYLGAGPTRAVDGNTDGAFKNGSVTHTNLQGDPQAWWQVDLGASRSIDTVEVWNRTDPCCAGRLRDFHVLVSDHPFGSDPLEQILERNDVWSRHVDKPGESSTPVAVNGTGRYVRVQLSDKTGTVPLSLAEVRVFED